MAISEIFGNHDWNGGGTGPGPSGGAAPLPGGDNGTIRDYINSFVSNSNAYTPSNDNSPPPAPPAPPSAGLDWRVPFSTNFWSTGQESTTPSYAEPDHPANMWDPRTAYTPLTPAQLSAWANAMNQPPTTPQPLPRGQNVVNQTPAGPIGGYKAVGSAQAVLRPAAGYTSRSLQEFGQASFEDSMLPAQPGQRTLVTAMPGQPTPVSEYTSRGYTVWVSDGTGTGGLRQLRPNEFIVGGQAYWVTR